MAGERRQEREEGEGEVERASSFPLSWTRFSNSCVSSRGCTRSSERKVSFPRSIRVPPFHSYGTASCEFPLSIPTFQTGP
jgi:hypothetical protein